MCSAVRPSLLDSLTYGDERGRRRKQETACGPEVPRGYRGNGETYLETVVVAVLDADEDLAEQTLGWG